MRCDSCGSRQLRREVFRDNILDICELCEAPHGDDLVVRSYLDIQRAKERGIDLAIWPLFDVLDRWSELTVERASAGDSWQRIPPFVFFSLKRNTLKPLEKLSISLQLSASRMHSRWVVECGYKKSLQFRLRPMFFGLAPKRLSEVIEIAQSEIPALAASLARDMNLSWWARI